MMAKRKTGLLYLLVLWALISALAWPAFIVAATVIAYFNGEGWQLDAWTQIPKRDVLAHFLNGYVNSLVFTLPLGLIAVVDYLLLSRYRSTWLVGGILLPAAGAAIAFAFFKQPFLVLPTFLAAGILLAIVHRLLDVVAGSSTRGSLR